jgi:hypothetical protein
LSIYSLPVEVLSSGPPTQGGNLVGVDLAGFPPTPRLAVELQDADQRKGSGAGIARARRSEAVKAHANEGLRPVGSYPELLRQSHTGSTGNCGRWGLVGKCQTGHRFIRPLICGYEWCINCGSDGSDAHKKRKAPWIEKVMSSSSWLYLVFTLPPEVRADYRTQKKIGALGVALKRLLQRAGYDRGLRRWHWFGDRSRVYHPHLNVLVPGEWMDAATLVRIKRSYATILGVAVDRVNVRVSARRGPSAVLHSVRYITRSTFKQREWDLDLARELVGFRNSSSWGRNWERVWELPKGEETEGAEVKGALAARLLDMGICPDCGSSIKWEGVETFHRGALWRDVGGGYYTAIAGSAKAKT